jgi:NTE family protein
MTMHATPTQQPKIGLVLPGGGARAAYQVGVLRAIARLVPKDAPSPFQIITGTSAGSINAAALAIHADHFRRAVLRISRVWKNFHVNQVFRADVPGLGKAGAHWMAAMMLGGLGRYNPHSLLDRTPLRALLGQYLPCERIQHSIDAGLLHAVGITASNYRLGHSVTFFQAHPSVPAWNRERRIGYAEGITVDHLMASSAIPLVFSAIKIGNDYFGDGSIRQVAPLSPALHLGADRILVVGIRKRRDSEATKPDNEATYPTVAEVAGHILDSIFLDSLDTDLERLERINRTISLIPNHHLVQSGITLRPVEVLTITPSQGIDTIAARHAHLLPRPLRFLLQRIGAFRGHGATLLSYLLFEQEYCRELIQLGYHDAMRRREDIMNLLRIDARTVPVQLRRGAAD